jgi:hypothetical protein
MFKNNKYTKWYFSIVERGKNNKNGLFEIHHIIPKSLGGTDDEYNLVKLTPREHYVCHWLLTKMTEGIYKSKMTFSLHTFFHFNKHRKLSFTSRQYDFHKKKFIEACQQRIPHTKKEVFRFGKQSNGEEFVGTRSEFAQYSGLTKQEINWLVNYCINPEDPKKLIKGWGIWIENINKFSFEKIRPPYGVQLLSDKVCENCNKKISCGNYKRWHGPKCKTVDPKGHYERTRQVVNINADR